jgi:hypothetical protein
VLSAFDYEQTLVFYVSFIPYFRLLVFGILVTLVAWFSFRFFLLGHLVLQNVNKDYVIFLCFRNFLAKSDQKPKTKYGMNETLNFGNSLIVLILTLFCFVNSLSCISRAERSGLSVDSGTASAASAASTAAQGI